MVIENYMKKDLERGNVPDSLWAVIEDTLDETFRQKLNLIKEGKNKAIVLTGRMSPLKLKFAVCLLKYYVERNKSVKWIEPCGEGLFKSTYEDKHSYATCFNNLDKIVDASFLLRISALIQRILLDNCVTILLVQNLTLLGNCLGDDTLDFLTHYMVEVTFPNERKEDYLTI